MTPPTHPELDALDALLASEGWRLLEAWIDQEWGAVGFASKVSKTLGDPQMNPALAVAQLQQATVAQQAVTGIRQWPAQRIQQLKRQQVLPEATMSRRGPGL